ncbi:MAG TPA: UDP-N-acetylmuramoyl-L-alanyl-D-glutamate--2,6-diaminopimelate ligase [Polyangiaceae bacterium]|nr:UDP-N-acetylmuramoyl-L-alanyl-D-glutamate--2,6-diaminopimelate ligase [Polyangiaceae bacterium]
MKDLAMSFDDQPPSGASSAGLSLSELSGVLAELSPRISGDAGVRVVGVRQDSRRVEPGELFVAREGKKTGGAAHALDAAARGAVALLLERGQPLPATRLPLIEVSNVKRALALAAEAVYGFPSRAVDVIGVTGTNGKTTTTFLLEQGLALAGARPARLGTLGFAMAGKSLGGNLTTPEADDVSRSLKQVRDAGGSHLVMEVSSIALVQERVSGIRFKVGAFTNLTQDHLDFHGTMQAYAEAKAELFTRLLPELSVLHVGDAFGRALAGRIQSGLLTVARQAPADIHALRAESTGRGLRASLVTPRGNCELQSPLVGEHNLENLLVAMGVLVGLGMDPVVAAQALSQAPQVPGRLERVDRAGDDVTVLVDYAHTPDALARVLSAVRAPGAGRVLCVFGCGGDRDPNKRRAMGEAVARGADFGYVTSDNPRSEDPQAIVDAILPGMQAASGKYEVELDRARAIEVAVLGAQPGDVIVIAGKGHEDYQIIGADKRHFDDREQARLALDRRARARAKEQGVGDSGGRES